MRKIFNYGTPDEERSYSVVFFISVVILTISTGWMFVDEFFLRRPWKNYQLESDEIEYAKFEEKYNEEKNKVAAAEGKLREEIKNIDISVQGSDEYKKVATDIKKIDIALTDVKQEHKFAKSRLDEAYYWYKHALHTGEKDVPEKKQVVEDTQKEVDSFLPEIDKISKEKADIEKKLHELGNVDKKKELEDEIYKITTDMSIYKSNMDAIKKEFMFLDFYRIPEIKQVVITGLDKNNFDQPIERVDRCESCHTLIGKAGFEDRENPFKTHPELPTYIGKHPTAKFGCTVCHMGQGPAISTVESAHGHFHHETDITPVLYEPLYKGDFIYSSCRNCHNEQLEVSGGEPLNKGKKLFIKLGCHGCHLVDGYDKLRKVGPSLKRVGDKVDPSWLFRWVKKPKDYLPNTRMPNFGLSDEDAEAITAYLISSSDKEYDTPYKFIPEKGNVEEGQRIFETVGCMGCHAINGKGNEFAPDLSNIAKKVNADWLLSWLINPKQYNHNTIMPSLRLSEDESYALTSYLLTLGKMDKIPGFDEKITQQTIIDNGAMLIRKRGCFACHDINGMEAEQRIAPELTYFGNKLLHQLEFGDSEVPHNWEAWTRNKLKDPAIFRTERVLDKMPNFNLSDEEIDSLIVLLKSFRGIKVPDKFNRLLTKDEEYIEEGRRLVWQFNCYGCHKIENKGGDILQFYDRPSDGPPILEAGMHHEGEKAQGLWLYGFLKRPVQIRPWLSIRMPTFYFTDEEVTEITRYFGALAKSDSLYDYVEQREIEKENIDAALKLISKDYLDCFECHSFGNLIKSSGSPLKAAPDLANVKKRLRPDWIVKWLSNPGEMMPRTRMPNFFDLKEGTSESSDILDGDPVRQINALRDFLIYYDGDVNVKISDGKEGKKQKDKEGKK